MRLIKSVNLDELYFNMLRDLSIKYDISLSDALNVVLKDYVDRLEHDRMDEAMREDGPRD